MAATENLYVVFAEAWGGSRRNIAEAFTEFTGALQNEHEFKHLEVAKVIPKRRPYRT